MQMCSMETYIRHNSFLSFEGIHASNYTCAKLKTYLITPGRKQNQSISTTSTSVFCCLTRTNCSKETF